MPRSAAHAQRRHRELLDLLARGRTLSTRALAARFKVNEMTIRRDLKTLESSGAALRCYGGAIAAQRISFEFAFDQRRRQFLAQKRRIGTAAAALIAEGDFVFLDTGTTTAEVASALVSHGVRCRVATSSLVIASILWGHAHIQQLLLLGGEVRPGSPDLVGPGTELMLEKLSADVAFLGSEGVDPERGSFAGDIESARIAEHMVRAARRIAIVADHSKLGRAALVRYAAVEDIDELITDSNADPQVVSALRQHGVKVCIA